MIADFIFYRKSLSETDEIKAGVKFLTSKHNFMFSHILEDWCIDVFLKEKVEIKSQKIMLFGFLAYKGLYNNDAAQLLINETEPEWDKAYGDYSVFYLDKKQQINIFLDPLRKYHVFRNKENNVLSSSLLAICHISNKLTLDNDAVYERLAMGYNIAPTTIFSEIERIYYPEDIVRDKVSVINNLLDFSSKHKFSSKEEALNHQVKVLTEQFESYDSFLKDKKSDIGVSDGMDSRLLLSLFNNLPPKQLQLHTHLNKDAESHVVSSSIAKQMADTLNVPLVIKSNKRLIQMSRNELENNFWDNFIYFDGRNAFNMGAMAPNYTKNYKDRVMGDSEVSFNGIGGEIFRNYYYTNLGKRSLKLFAQNRLFYIFAKDFLPKKAYMKFWYNFKSKLSHRLNYEVTNHEDLSLIRRYYSEVFMPDCDAINNNAHNKFYHFLTPFIEPSVLKAAYGIEPYLGLSIGFEGEIIKKINLELAKIKTHYGYIDTYCKNYKQQLKYYVNAYAPQYLFRIRLNMAKRQLLKRGANKDLIKHIENNAPWFYDAWKFFQGLYPDVDFRYIEISSDTALNNTFMLANSIYYFKDKIKTK